MSVIDLTQCDGPSAASSKVQQAIQQEVARATAGLTVTMSLRHFTELAKLAKLGQEQLDRKSKQAGKKQDPGYSDRRDRARQLLLEGNIPAVVAAETGLSGPAVHGIRMQLKRKGELKV